jgi:cobalt-zinc-cadmium efflux system outer membrane protein
MHETAGLRARFATRDTMSTRHWALPGALAAALFGAAPGHAQPHAAGTPHPITLGLDAAWARQPEQQAAPLRRDAAAAALQASRRWLADAPAIEASAKTDRFDRNDGSREVEATLTLPLWHLGERHRAQAAAEADAAAIEARLGAARWTLAGQVRSAYWALAAARLEQQLAEARLDNSRRLADDVAARLKAGDLARADNHQAQSALAAAEADLAQAQAAATRAARQWQALTGLPPPQAAEPPAEPAPAAAGETAATHPELAELAARAAAARRQRELAGAQTGANPELTVGATRERGRADERYAPAIVVGIRIPLGASSGSPARLATAGAEQAEAEAALALATGRVQADIASARDDVQALQAAATAADRRALLARESRGFHERSFRLGETDLPTRLRVELEAFEAGRQASRARIALSGAVSTLRQAMGLLPE